MPTERTIKLRILGSAELKFQSRVPIRQLGVASRVVFSWETAKTTIQLF